MSLSTRSEVDEERWRATSAGIDWALAPPARMVPGKSDYAYGYAVGQHHAAQDRVAYWAALQHRLGDEDPSWLVSEVASEVHLARAAVASHVRELANAEEPREEVVG